MEVVLYGLIGKSSKLLFRPKIWTPVRESPIEIYSVGVLRLLFTLAYWLVQCHSVNPAATSRYLWYAVDMKRGPRRVSYRNIFTGDPSRTPV